MSDEKILQHMEKAVHAVTNKKKSWKVKVKDFLLEIVIIVIAVSLTLWFHNLNDRRHERQLEKNFLIGIRNDLKRDTSYLNGVIVWTNRTLVYYDSVWKQMFSYNVDPEFLDAHWTNLLNTAYMVFDYSLFENFKSSGNLRLIENKKLLRNITHLYANEIPFYQNADRNNFDSRRTSFDTYIGRKALIDSSGIIHISKLLNDPAVRYQIMNDRSFFNERKRHVKYIKKDMTEVINEINEELDKRF